MANPPWHAPAGTPSPDPERNSARRAATGLFAAWAHALAQPLRHHGTCTLVVASAHMAPCLAALAQAGCGGLSVLPLWPKPGRPAKLVLLRGIKNGRGGSRILPGLVLHGDDGGFTPQAQAILRDGAPLDF